MEQLLCVCLGGAVGTGARYLLTVWTLRALGSAFPYGTLIVNVTGSFLVAALMYFGLETTAMTPNVRLTLTTGVIGGFTTYSAFTYETMIYLQAGAWGVAILNVVVTVFGCLAACFLGWMVARMVFGT